MNNESWTMNNEYWIINKKIDTLISNLDDYESYLFYESTPTSIIAVDDNNNFHETTIGRGHWPTGKDLFINDEVYSIKVDGSDTENILKVQKTTDRPGKIKGKPSLGAGFENKGDINR